MAKGEFLLEVRCEEIPARMLAPALRELGTRVFEELMARRLPPTEIETGFTPRRLVLALTGLPEREPDRQEDVTGPPVSVAFGEDGSPTSAAVGFAKRCGIDPSQLERRETPRGEYVAALQSIRGRATSEVLAELTPRLLAGLTWPKSMRWATSQGPWARPIHGIVALFQGSVVPFELFGIASGQTTMGHPVLSPKSFDVSSFEDYRKRLAANGIEIDFEQRRATLVKRMKAAATALGGELVDDELLLDKLSSICAIPGVVEGRFDRSFLELPREVLIASLRDHQSALTVQSRGKLLPVFLTVMDRLDDPEGRVRAGNEWVVAARLADARFFYAEDCKRPLADRAVDLENLSFHARLGSYADKSERVVELCRLIGNALELEAETEEAVEAARLLKIDLTTEMVKEFTSLQGMMGGVYARTEGHPEPVWKAIYEQYQPTSTSDPVPSAIASRIVGLADRVDTIVGILGLGLVPTGSKDPFGLRRAAQGVVRIALEGEMEVDLDLVAAKAYQCYEDRLDLPGEEVLATWRPFLFDRVRHILGREGYAYDEIEAARVVGGSNLPDLRARVDALNKIRQEPAFLDVVLAAKRIANILRDTPEKRLREELLAEEAEMILYQAYVGLKNDVDRSEAEGQYEHCLRAIAKFSDVLDRFFVEVLVMDENEDLRNNRIALLQAIQRTLSRTAALTEVVVEKKSGESANA
ncbi:MAG: glycine--tRNA ligase subunit beta [Acidobacteriota bacterium]|nr:glycine--tRNA ligase subunit beta [Acidobacteriota bacterium]